MCSINRLGYTITLSIKLLLQSLGFSFRTLVLVHFASELAKCKQIVHMKWVNNKLDLDLVWMNKSSKQIHRLSKQIIVAASTLTGSGSICNHLPRGHVLTYTFLFIICFIANGTYCMQRHNSFTLRNCIKLHICVNRTNI